MPKSSLPSELTWPPFKGRIALVAPASAVAKDVFDATLRQLQALGIDYHLGAHAQASYRYLAGTVEQRLEDLHTAFELPDIGAIWCLRGGYGSAQLVPHLDWARLQAASPRPLIGFSDISILLSAFHRHGLPAIHGPVATTLGLPPLSSAHEQHERQVSLASVARVLAGLDRHRPATHLNGPKHPVQGTLIGGNLTALASTAGTLAGLHAPAGSILVLEDVGEPYYRLERCLWQILQNIDAKALGAVVMGTYTDCPRNGVTQSLDEIFSEYLQALDVPLYHLLPCGHGAQNRAWPYGRMARLDETGLSW